MSDHRPDAEITVAYTRDVEIATAPTLLSAAAVRASDADRADTVARLHHALG